MAIATYRLQLRPGFGFKEAEALIPYLTELGISHLYTSPYLQAISDSTHGYDVVDPTKVNAQLGSIEDHDRMCEALQEAGMGLLIDVVPNHMAIVGKQNPWWWDVLENGQSSPFATYFDVDWEASEERWPNKILLPVLGNHYGRILENGQIQLSYKDGVFTLRYQEHSFPVDPSTLGPLLSSAAESCHSEELAFLAESHSRLPRPTVTSRRLVERRHRDKDVLTNMLVRLCREEPDSKAAIEAAVARLNRDPDTMDALIEQQNYRLAFWRTANKEIGYRRFFDIKELVGLRIEDPEVFDTIHRLPFQWFKKGWVQGFRIDHPDGLLNPAEYFNRLNEACPDVWIVAEKILKPGERLPASWKIAGTTGYDFIHIVDELFISPSGKDQLTRIYDNIVGEGVGFETILYESKRLVLTQLFGSELHRLTTLFVEMCERHRRHRDYTAFELQEALCETAACFPIYRTYVSPSEKLVTESDETYVSEAVATAMEKRPDLDPELFRFLKNILLLRVQEEYAGELALRFQQLTPPTMAKGFEDTALYRYYRLVALNEVGGDPDQFGISLNEFHDHCLYRCKNHPTALSASTTHDTKRSEDVRTRLAVLSEMPDLWAEAIQRWSDLNARYRSNLLDRKTEYLCYQTLVGAWPIDQSRLGTYIEKAAREAKEQTSWIKPNQEYEKALQEFVAKILDYDHFIADFEEFIKPIVEAGRINSLAQTLIKLTAPGIPDIYQGCELWNLSLVDPDNRRNVDFELHQNLLKEIEALPPEKILERMNEGLPKLWLIKQALRLRKERPKAFQGDYVPLIAHGDQSEHIVAFIRGGEVIAAAPRLLMEVRHQWNHTTLDLPPGSWKNILNHDQAIQGSINVADLFAHFPVALLVKL